MNLSVLSALPAPALSSSPLSLADLLEVGALVASDRIASAADLSSVLRASGTIDAVGEPATEDDHIDAAVDSAFRELEARLGACASAYPFSLDERTIQASVGAKSTTYAFLLVLSCSGRNVGPAGSHPERLFEQLSARAARSYFGGAKQNADSYHFGYPRSTPPRGFAAALNTLCERLGEGGGCRQRPRTPHQKDAKLDVVVWKDFGDRLPGKLIAFGQCATGGDWQDKRTELQPNDWCRHWMKDAPLVVPQKLFFVPHRIEPDEWGITGTTAGVVFDRCRIASHATPMAEPVRALAAAWSGVVIRKIAKT